jgi:predicted transcriptional regulator YdeE
MEPRIIEIQTKKIAGYEIREKNTNMGEIPKFWHEIMEDGRHGKMQSENLLFGPDYGVMFHTDADDEFIYMVGREIKPGEQSPNGMICREINGGKYAAFTTTLPQISEAYSIAYDWIEKSEYTSIAKGTDFELYDERMMQNQTMEIWMQIK